MSPRHLRLRVETNVQLVAGVNLLPLRADEDALPEVFPKMEVLVRKDKKTDPHPTWGSPPLGSNGRTALRPACANEHL